MLFKESVNPLCETCEYGFLQDCCTYRRRAALAAEEQYAKEGPDNSDASSHSHLGEDSGGLKRVAGAEAGVQQAAPEGSRGGQTTVSETDSPALAVLQRRR